MTKFLFPLLYVCVLAGCASEPKVTNPRVCPKCHSPTVRIVYGAPYFGIDSDFGTKNDRIIHGGCQVYKGMPTRSCLVGHYQFTTPEDQKVYFP